jgi:hypothetical protein
MQYPAMLLIPSNDSNVAAVDLSAIRGNENLTAVNLPIAV